MFTAPALFCCVLHNRGKRQRGHLIPQGKSDLARREEHGVCRMRLPKYSVQGNMDRQQIYDQNCGERASKMCSWHEKESRAATRTTFGCKIALSLSLPFPSLCCELLAVHYGLETPLATPNGKRQNTRAREKSRENRGQGRHERITGRCCK